MKLGRTRNEAENLGARRRAQKIQQPFWALHTRRECAFLRIDADHHFCAAIASACLFLPFNGPDRQHIADAASGASCAARY